MKILSPLNKELKRDSKDHALLEELRENLKADKILVYFARKNELHYQAYGFCEHEEMNIAENIIERNEQLLDEHSE